MKNKTIFLYSIAIFLSLGLANVSSAATIFTDDFNSYVNGNAHGQGGWMGFGSEELFTIQSSIVKEGSRALKSSGNFPQIAVGIHKNGVLVPTGRIKYYFRADEGAPYSGFRLLENSSVKVEVIFNIGAHTVHYRNNSSQNIIMGSFNADTWYSMVIEWRDSDKKVRYRFNEGDFTPWVSPISPWASGLHRITLYRNVGGATSHVYYDDIQDPITNNSKTPALIVP